MQAAGHGEVAPKPISLMIKHVLVAITPGLGNQNPSIHVDLCLYTHHFLPVYRRHTDTNIQDIVRHQRGKKQLCSQMRRDLVKIICQKRLGESMWQLGRVST
jgi:hypothetical protein